MHLSPQVKDQAIEILEAGESVFGKLEKAAEVTGNLLARTPGA
jgi:hypothetical protein